MTKNRADLTLRNLGPIRALTRRVAQLELKVKILDLTQDELFSRLDNLVAAIGRRKQAK